METVQPRLGVDRVTCTYSSHMHTTISLTLAPSFLRVLVAVGICLILLKRHLPLNFLLPVMCDVADGVIIVLNAVAASATAFAAAASVDAAAAVPRRVISYPIDSRWRGFCWCTRVLWQANSA